MKRLSFHLYVLSILFSLSVSTSAQTRRALVIGLGEQKDTSWAKINGDKDVPYVKAMLTRAGYNDIRTLVNRQATKAGIVSAFRSLTNSCKSGDIVYIHFSGHGQQVTDVSGDEQDDGLDESWIPYDAYLKYGQNDRGEKHLIDDELNFLLARIADKIGNRGKMLVVVDACHSGDISRGDEDEDRVTVRGVYDDFIIPVKTKRKAAKGKERWLTLSACQDFQVNQEIKKPQVGKLTYALYSVAQKGTISFEAIEAFMNKYRSRLPQNPELTGKKQAYRLSDFLK